MNELGCGIVFRATIIYQKLNIYSKSYVILQIYANKFQHSEID